MELANMEHVNQIEQGASLKSLLLSWVMAIFSLSLAELNLILSTVAFGLTCVFTCYKIAVSVIDRKRLNKTENEK